MLAADTQIALFDYAALDAETRIVVQQRTEEMRTLVRRSAQDIVDIGQKLIDVKGRLGHGKFGGWLAAEFEWSYPMAARFMAVAETFQSINLIDLAIAPSALYMLASPSTPEGARIEALERAEQGERITYTAAREIVQEYAEKRITPADLLAVAVEDDDDEGEEDETAREYEFNRQQALDASRAGWAIAVPPPAPEPEPVRPHVAYNAGNNEWYTPPEYIAAAVEVMGGIDLDPATSEAANTVVGAARIFTAQDDGLLRFWQGRVWMNPPYASELVGRFADKLALHASAGDVTEAIVLVNNATETAWFNTLVGVASAVVFPRGRVRFWEPGGALSAPLQGQAVIYIGPSPAKFLDAFRRFGWGATL